jgi:hypothetical protein
LVILAAVILVVYVTLIADPTAYSASSRSDNSTGNPNAVAPTSTGAMSSPQDLNATQQVLAQITQLLKVLQNQNLSGLQDYYTNESVLTLTGCTDGLGGRYTGLTEIKSLYANYENGMASFSFIPSGFTLSVIDSSTVNATYGLSITARGFFGTVDATAAVQQQWTLSSNSAQSTTRGDWAIEKDDWNFLSFAVDSPLIQVPACGS